jgi:hypothetical protein
MLWRPPSCRADRVDRARNRGSDRPGPYGEFCLDRLRSENPSPPNRAKSKKLSGVAKAAQPQAPAHDAVGATSDGGQDGGEGKPKGSHLNRLVVRQPAGIILSAVKLSSKSLIQLSTSAWFQITGSAGLSGSARSNRSYPSIPKTTAVIEKQKLILSSSIFKIFANRYNWWAY